GGIQDLRRRAGADFRVDRKGKKGRQNAMIKASVILSTAFVLTFFLRRRAAAERHIMWVAAIVSATLLPFFSFVLPSWQPGFARFASALPTLLLQTDAAASGSPGARVMFHAQSIETTTGILERAMP